MIPLLKAFGTCGMCRHWLESKCTLKKNAVPETTTAAYGCFLHTTRNGWVLELNIGDAWETVTPPNGSPYMYETREQAQSMLDRCYPTTEGKRVWKY